MTDQPQTPREPAAYRWRAPGNKHWIYDPTPEWIEDHKHEIEIEALYTAPQRCSDETASAWQPIETAPKDGNYVLVRNMLGNTHVAKFGLRYLGDPGPEAWVCDGKYIGSGVTHWMSLPASPHSRPHHSSNDKD